MQTAMLLMATVYNASCIGTTSTWISPRSKRSISCLKKQNTLHFD